MGGTPTEGTVDKLKSELSMNRGWPVMSCPITITVLAQAVWSWFPAPLHHLDMEEQTGAHRFDAAQTQLTGLELILFYELPSLSLINGNANERLNYKPESLFLVCASNQSQG